MRGREGYWCFGGLARVATRASTWGRMRVKALSWSWHPQTRPQTWQLSPSHRATRRQVSHHSQCGHSPSVSTALKSIPCWQMFAAVVVVMVSSLDGGGWGSGEPLLT